MISCTDVRWRMKEFLDGSLDHDTAESVRSHLDRCHACAVTIADETRVDSAVLDDVRAPQEFADQVLANFPEATVSTILFRYLCGTFALSVGVGISIFAIWRHVTHPGRPRPIGVQWSSLSDLQVSLPWLERIFSNATFNYLMLALLATVLTIALIIFIDHPRRRRLSAVRTGEQSHLFD